jgi:circadian clock protein KaiB
MQSAHPHYAMTLFITGVTVRSGRALANIQEFCETELGGDYELEVVDLYRTPERARLNQVVAAPTLIRREPKPARRVIGDMSDRRRLNDAIKVV